MSSSILEYKLHAMTNDYGRKLFDADRRIRLALKTGRRFYASFSGGKDSTVMLHLLRRFDPAMPVLYLRSGYALPGTDQFVIAAGGENLHILDAQIDYLELCREFGLPHQRSKAVQGRVVKQIKKDHIGEWAQEHGFTGCFWGLRADESRGRAALCKYKPAGVLDRRNVLRVAPLVEWTALDIWAYIYSNTIASNPLYDRENCGMTRETIRNTGWLSTDGENNGRLEWLRRNYPEKYTMVRSLL